MSTNSQCLNSASCFQNQYCELGGGGGRGRWGKCKSKGDFSLLKSDVGGVENMMDMNKSGL
jgi:hypothetical protein